MSPLILYFIEPWRAAALQIIIYYIGHMSFFLTIFADANLYFAL